MTLPWDRINDDAYKDWLLEVMAKEDYNSEPPLNRRTLKTQFEQQQQQQPRGDDWKEVVEFVRKQKTESETLVISEPKTEQFNTAVQSFGFKKDAATWKDKPSNLLDQIVEGFLPHKWLLSKEDSKQNRAAYMTYLCDSGNIRIPRDTQLFEGASERELLNVRFLGFGVKTSGNIDVVLAGSHHQSTATIRQHILVGIELKKDTNEEHSKIERQVVLQHIAASYLNPDTGVLTIMTDLNNRWHFFWFAQDNSLLRYEATTSEALYLLQHSLDKQGSVSAPIGLLNRSCWKDLFPSLDSIAELNSFEQADAEEDSEQGKDAKDGGDPFCEVGGRSSSQQGKNKGSQYHQGKSKGSVGGSKKQHARMVVDECLDFMDDEEMLEATFQMKMKTLFHRMVYVPETEETEGTNVPPSEILLG